MQWTLNYNPRALANIWDVISNRMCKVTTANHCAAVDPGRTQTIVPQASLNSPWMCNNYGPKANYEFALDTQKISHRQIMIIHVRRCMYGYTYTQKHHTQLPHEGTGQTINPVWTILD